MTCGLNHRNWCLTSVTTDVNNCGNCGVKCYAAAHSTPNCTNSKCGFDCVQGWKNCDGKSLNGCEMHVEWDVKNCGDCGNKCPHYAHTASPLCTGGNCTGVCLKGWSDCNNNLQSDGCEALLASDKNNCGQCGVQCPAAANAAGLCYTGKCGLQCSKGFANCDKQPANGCEVALLTDVLNCGCCGKSCPCPPNAYPTCAAGNCGFSCKDGFSDCNGASADGCEVSTASDVLHCGACGTKCDCPPNALPTCASGTCGYSCKDGFKDCNKASADGCEIDVATDVMNCGGCGTLCNCPPNAWPTCSGGQCGYTCKDGFKDCNGLPADGCEVELATDVSNCGFCGVACSFANAQPACWSGACDIQCCNDGFADCNNDKTDGCEVDLQWDISNCGGCGVACSFPNAQPQCSSGDCGIKSCNDGFMDCNGLLADGCEVDVASLNYDIDNCGNCGITCNDTIPNAYATCSEGQCGYQCNDGFKDCNFSPDDGCEVELATDIDNCGDCKQSCEDMLTLDKTGSPYQYQVCRSGKCCPCGSDQDCQDAGTPYQTCIQ